MTEIDADILARLQRQEDRDAIRETLNDYVYALDLKDFDQLGDVFAHDAVMECVGLDYRNPGRDGRYEGRDTILTGFYGRGQVREAQDGLFRTGHYGTNLRIELDGDEATTLAYFLELVNNTQLISGTYQHRMRREADRWRIVVLRITVMFHASIAGSEYGGRTLHEVLSRPL